MTNLTIWTFNLILNDYTYDIEVNYKSKHNGNLNGRNYIEDTVQSEIEKWKSEWSFFDNSLEIKWKTLRKYPTVK